MAELNRINQICTGMVAVASDGQRLGQVTQIYTREGETYLEVMSRGTVWNLWHLLGGAKRLYLPGTTVGAVTTTQVILAVDATTAHGYTSRPSWIPREPKPIYNHW